MCISKERDRDDGERVGEFEKRGGGGKENCTEPFSYKKGIPTDTDYQLPA